MAVFKLGLPKSLICVIKAEDEVAVEVEVGGAEVEEQVDPLILAILLMVIMVPTYFMFSEVKK